MNRGVSMVLLLLGLLALATATFESIGTGSSTATRDHAPSHEERITERSKTGGHEWKIDVRPMEDRALVMSKLEYHETSYVSSGSAVIRQQLHWSYNGKEWYEAQHATHASRHPDSSLDVVKKEAVANFGPQSAQHGVASNPGQESVVLVQWRWNVELSRDEDRFETIIVLGPVEVWTHGGEADTLCDSTGCLVFVYLISGAFLVVGGVSWHRRDTDRVGRN